MLNCIHLAEKRLPGWKNTDERSVSVVVSENQNNELKDAKTPLEQLQSLVNVLLRWPSFTFKKQFDMLLIWNINDSHCSVSAKRAGKSISFWGGSFCFAATRLEVWTPGEVQWVSGIADADSPFGCDEKKEADNVPWFICEQRGDSSWLHCCRSVFVCCSGVCVPHGSLADETHRHTHTHMVHRDWWWCTASVCCGASSALHTARRAQWLRLTQRECRSKETTISSQCTTYSSSARNSAALQLLEPSFRRLPGPAANVTLFNVISLLPESLNVEHLQFWVLHLISYLPF